MKFLKSLFNRNPKPDFYFAAKGYVQIAVLKREGKDETYLRRVEYAHGMELFNEGCSEEQALSARWGGCLAIEDDLVLFETAIEKGKAEATTVGHLPSEDIEISKNIYRTIYQNAGDFAARCAWEGDRTMYRRFLNHIGR